MAPSAVRPFVRGASPRGRRSRPRHDAPRSWRGRISAWAEEPRDASARVAAPTAHLRVGGGALRRSELTASNRGASPRGRRSLPHRAHGSDLRGRISAWAEEPTSSPRRSRAPGAHLRVGGGAGGGPMSAKPSKGASPRGRRSPRPRRDPGGRRGRISAWAEEPWLARRGLGRLPAHLRVGGGAVGVSDEPRRGDGASPRGRRSLGRLLRASEPVRRISAWAEEPVRACAPSHAFAAHLRVGGGAPATNATTTT